MFCACKQIQESKTSEKKPARLFSLEITGDPLRRWKKRTVFCYFFRAPIECGVVPSNPESYLVEAQKLVIG